MIECRICRKTKERRCYEKRPENKTGRAHICRACKQAQKRQKKREAREAAKQEERDMRADLKLLKRQFEKCTGGKYRRNEPED